REEAPARDAGGRGGWLSDLLNRASRDEGVEPARAPARADRARTNSLESLDSISVDIARMIDHEAAVELWDRYRRGESNVFTRRLYTLQGQQTFDEIRRKYRRDEEFRQTVDRYVEEFERLLSEVSRDDRDSMLTKTYLTSETGKVYTMLAHASGRFD
ncbi:kinesin, partial [Microvirga sp. CF3016]|nr:kinesin [Microvirga sp. CF3016]